ncbi:helix-turn-helix protein [Microbacterium sp. AG1240]|uniref:helix-turn-helix domain-containing protein n=1 Tax=Microbacterium sp. AG1240 TaxID=2183992 RepID=UPI000F24FF87|nr:helix-turn-helix transcriptional regulator [Microbacterium sp. AG1240]RKT36003.1 helix-turn-helix protein [Microbacterium sp. AG1240]
MGTIASHERSERAARAGAGVAAVGRRIHAQRTAQGLSLQEFATLAGVDAPALSALERGEGATTLFTLYAAADALGVPAGAFVSVGDTSADAAPAAPVPNPTPVPATGGDHGPTERAPRTFADLRKGALAGRTFDTLPQFAVAAVLEARYSVAAIARVFRVPAWKLQGWVDEKTGPDAASHRR